MSLVRHFLLPLLFAAASAAAHEGASAGRGPNGGQVRDAGPYHVELVVAADAAESAQRPIAVYLTGEGDRKVSSAGIKGSATLLSGKAKSVAELKPDGDNRLTGTAQYAATPALKVVVALTLADGRTVQARFEPLKPAP